MDNNITNKSYSKYGNILHKFFKFEKNNHIKNNNSQISITNSIIKNNNKKKNKKIKVTDNDSNEDIEIYPLAISRPKEKIKNINNYDIENKILDFKKEIKNKIRKNIKSQFICTRDNRVIINNSKLNIKHNKISCKKIIKPENNHNCCKKYLNFINSKITKKICIKSIDFNKSLNKKENKKHNNIINKIFFDPYKAPNIIKAPNFKQYLPRKNKSINSNLTIHEYDSSYDKAVLNKKNNNTLLFTKYTKRKSLFNVNKSECFINKKDSSTINKSKLYTDNVPNIYNNTKNRLINIINELY